MAGLIGIFGGTFDPPHIGHLILADEARNALGLDKVLWVVAGEPPHKPENPISPAETRIGLVQAAIEGVEQFVLSRADVDRPGPHYTVGTLEWLRQQGVQDRFVYLMGSDSLNDLLNWHRPQDFLNLCHQLGVMVRPGSEPKLAVLAQQLPSLEKKTRFFQAPLIEISGTDIRRRVKDSQSYRFMVPPRVAARIKELKLYR